MPRIPYADRDGAAPAELVDSIRRRRGGALLELDRMLLHSPAFARGWNVFLGDVRGGLSIAPRLRELAICSVALLNRAAYEYHHHAPAFLDAGGTKTQLDALPGLVAGGARSPAFDDTEHAVVQMTVELTRDVVVSDGTFATVEELLANRQQLVELVGVIAAYNMVSRFLVAFGIEPE